MAKIIVQNTEITVSNVNGEDYICITDMLKAKDGDFFVTDWLRNRNTMEFLGVWEMMHNLNFIMANSPQLECWQTYASHIDVVVKNIYYRQLFWFIANNILSLHSN